VGDRADVIEVLELGFEVTGVIHNLIGADATRALNL